MKIEFLYFDDCPNSRPAWELLKEVLDQEGVDSPILPIHVETEEQARLHRFPGSPTIRINDRDVAEENDSAYGLKCRVYATESGTRYWPPRQWIEQTIQMFKDAD